MERRVVLVVEDDVDLRETLVEILTTHGFEVFGARDGLEALAVIREIPPPGIIVLDLRMPRMSGFELFEELRSARWQPPIIILTGSAHWQAAVRQFPNVVGVLQKPFSHERLVELVDRCAVTPATAAATEHAPPS